MAPIVDQLAIPLDEAKRRVAALDWYHTIEIAPGLTTNGRFDLRHALPLLPFPDVEGKRCLDIGPWDGFYAYEMARRGAKEVVAIDLADLTDIDYPPQMRHRPGFDPSHKGKQERFAGFHLVQELTDTPVEWRACSIYDLDPNEIGTFDMVTCGSLLVHLRDPVRALDAVRSVTTGHFLSIDYIHAILNLVPGRRPLFMLRGKGGDFQWWMASQTGLRHLLWVGGFDIVNESKRFLLTFGPAGRSAMKGVAGLQERALNWAFTRDPRPGHPHVGYLCRPRF